jgi:hypothetical protein
MVTGFVLLVAWAMILSGNRLGRGAADDFNYHWPAIERFASELPSPDLSDYASATTPGYHLILAPFARIGIGHTGIQLIASLWTLGFLGVLTWVAAGRFGKGTIVLMLPLLVSMFVIYPAIWLLPDNAGWFGVLIILLLALKPDPNWKTWALSGGVLIGLVLVRQIHIWAAGVIWLSAWLGSDTQTPTLTRFYSSIFDRFGRALIALGCTIPAFAALVWFVLLWGGLVPPTFQSDHQGSNPATPPFILTQLTILSVFFIPMLWARLKEVWKHQSVWILLAAFLGATIGIIPVSSYSIDAGRYGGWWNVIGKVPTIADRSPIIVLGSVLGAIAFVAWMSLASRRDVWIWVGTLVAFTLAQSANHTSWQRYHEPMLLIMIVLILARSSSIKPHTRSIMLGSIGLAAMLGVLTLIFTLNAKPVEIQNQPSAESTILPDLGVVTDPQP